MMEDFFTSLDTILKSAPTAGDAHLDEAMGGKRKNKPKKDAVCKAVTFVKRAFSVDQRKAAAKSGKAMPNGSYPILTRKDLKNAISTVGLGSSGKEAIKAHIKSRAAALGATKMLPDDWK